MDVSPTPDLSPTLETVRPRSAPGRLIRLFVFQSMGALGGSLMSMSMFFYMHQVFAWGPMRNLLLSAGSGAVYTTGALLADPVSRRIGRRPMMRMLALSSGLLMLLATRVTTAPELVVVLLAYQISVSMQWPALESLICAGANAGQLSTRIATYNFIWSGIGTITFAATGAILQWQPMAMFIFAMLSHLSGAALLLADRTDPAGSPEHAAPEPGLLHMRTLAMRLSRIALPATYAVIYALGPLLPTLPVLHSFSQQAQTMLASIWMASRWATFGILGVTSWWHTRPRAMWIAAIGLVIAFLGITQPAALFGAAPPFALSMMILAQLGLGVALGIIYCGSLYFGMVLSDGSTEHGGYHEALIGVGFVLGPASGAIGLLIDDSGQSAGIAAVSLVLLVSVVASTMVSVQRVYPAKSPAK